MIKLDPRSQLYETHVQLDNVTLVPVYHHRLAFAQWVRDLIISKSPDAIAVEWPDTLESHFMRAIDYLPRASVLVVPEGEHAGAYPISPADAMVEAGRMAHERDLPLYCIDSDVPISHAPPGALPDPFLVTQLGLRKSLEVLHRLWPDDTPDNHTVARERAMGHALRRLSFEHDRVVAVVGLAHLTGIVHAFYHKVDLIPLESIERSQVMWASISYQSLRYAMQDLPFNVFQYELARRGLHLRDVQGLIQPPELNEPTEEESESFAEREADFLDKLAGRPTTALSVDVLDGLSMAARLARADYDEAWSASTPFTRMSLLLHYARNLSLLHGLVVPTHFDLLLAGKQMVNEDFAWEIHRYINYYPFFGPPSAGVDEIDLAQNQVSLGGRVLKIRYRQPIHRRRVDAPMKQAPRPKRSTSEEWNGFGAVSYPPEDARIEGFFKYLKEKAVHLIHAMNEKVVPFETSLLDGLDIRETLRHLVEGKLYVRESITRRVSPNDFDALIVAFEPPHRLHEFTYEMIWYAEHQNESDLFVISTEPGQTIVGPGISRCEYGAVLSLFPPGQIRESDRSWAVGARDELEMLILAAIRFSRSRLIGYAGVEPPPAAMKQLAERNGKHLLTIPLHTFPEATVKRLRIYHALDDRRRRRDADRFIRMD